MCRKEIRSTTIKKYGIKLVKECNDEYFRETGKDLKSNNINDEIVGGNYINIFDSFWN